MIDVPREFYANRKWRMKALRDGATVPGAARALREACAKDILFWVNTFCWTSNPRLIKSPILPFTTYPFQDRAILRLLDDIRSGRDVVIEKSRDMGASWLNIIVATWILQFMENTNGSFVSRNESYVDAPGNPKSLFWKLDFILAHEPKWLRPREMKRTSMHIGNLDNGAMIDGESTTGEVGRGDRRTYSLMDEFASFEQKDGYNALNATQDMTNCRIFNSTPKGKANAFYDMAEKARKGGVVDLIRMHWSEHPKKNQGLYSSKRDMSTGRMEVVLMDSWCGIVLAPDGKKVAFPEAYPFVLDGKVRSPWYDVQCERAVSKMQIAQELDIDYAGSDYQFFDSIAVERYRTEFCRDPDIVGDLVYTPETCTMRKIEPNPKGLMRLWLPLDAHGGVSKTRRFVMGVDVAAGTGASNSTIAVYERGTNEKVAEYANPCVLPDEFGRVVVSVARFFNNAKIIPDASGPTGKVCLMRVLAEGYSNIYVGRDRTKLDGRDMGKWGVYLNPAKRTEVLHSYRDAIQNRLVINRSAESMDECAQFVCTMQGFIEHAGAANATDPSGASANHGDRVIADALAAMELTDESSHEEAQEPDIPEGTLAWRMREESRKAAARAHANSEAAEWPDETLEDLGLTGTEDL